MARLSKEDWLAEGFKILNEFAQDKLRILYLCERLKVTRGSFYHHFTSIGNFVEELMESWEQQNTLKLIAGANKGQSPEERMDILAKMVGESDQLLEAAIRSWSFYHPIVRKHLAKVDQMRLRYVQEIFEEMGHEKKEAYKLAQLDYGTLVGIQQLFPNISKKQLKDLWAIQKKQILPK